MTAMTPPSAPLPIIPEEEHKIVVEKLTRDLKESARKLTPMQARYLVGLYYQQQDQRIRAANRERAAGEASEPHACVSWVFDQCHTLERRVASMLSEFSNAHVVGRWMRGNKGIGPVLSAGLLAHLDIKRAPTAGHFFSFAGIAANGQKWLGKAADEMVKNAFKAEPDPARALYALAVTTGRKFADLAAKGGVTLELPSDGKIVECLNICGADPALSREAFEEARRVCPESLDNALKRAIIALNIQGGDVYGDIFRGVTPDKKTLAKELARRPWNADLKTLVAFKCGESFVKVSGHEDAFYGKLYAQYKQDEIQWNESGKNAEAAKKKLETVKIGKDTDAFGHYSSGRLPPAHVHARARRRTVKMFLSHVHEVMYITEYGKAPPEPYAIAHLGHAHRVPVPNWPME